MKTSGGFCCSFYGCPIRKCSRWPYVSLFQIPSQQHPEWREEVVRILCRTREKKSLNLNRAHICSIHYEEDCFTFNSLGHRKLKIGSLPTRNLPQRKHDTVRKPRKAPAVRTPPVVPEKVKYLKLDELKIDVEKNFVSWVVHETSDDYVIIRQAKTVLWTVYIVVKQDFNYDVNIDGYYAPSSVGLDIIDLMKVGIKILFEKINQLKICPGKKIQPEKITPASMFIHTPMPTYTMVNKSENRTCFNGHSVYRSINCFGFVVDGICKSCEKAIQHHEKKENTPLTKFSPLSLATSTQLINEVKQSRVKITNLKKRLTDVGNRVLNCQNGNKQVALNSSITITEV